jgi:hypothetical protein
MKNHSLFHTDYGLKPNSSRENYIEEKEMNLIQHPNTQSKNC